MGIGSISHFPPFFFMNDEEEALLGGIESGYVHEILID